MRATLRVPALVSVVGFVLGLINAISLYRADPCPPGLGGLAFLYAIYVIFVLGIAPALIGIIPATVFAARSRQWVWLAVLLVAAVPGLAVVAAELNLLPSDIASPLLRLGGLFGHVFACGYGGSAFSFDVAFAVMQAPAPIVLLIYSFWGIPRADSPADAARRESDTHRLLWGAAIIAVAVGLLFDGLLLKPPQPLSLIVGMIGVFGWNIAFPLGGVLSVFAFQRREWAWFAGLMVSGIATLLLNLLLYVPLVFFFYNPLAIVVAPLYRLFYPNYIGPSLTQPYSLKYVLPIALPLVILAYVWWIDRRGRRSTPASVAPPPAPVTAP